ncbi:MAG TPA: ATP synthase F0 subunit B [Pyrinomonadaceae bacterium]|nr:ATP synthase F0 subunit B [Pyrinomonadaceae bacterium]
MFVLAFAESIQLFPDGSLFVHIAFILLMIWILNRTFFRPINAILKARERHKGGRGGEADELRQLVSKKQSEYEAAMLAARNESYELIERERAEAVERRQKMISDARADAAKRLADERDRLRDEVADAKVEIVREANQMSDRITANILNG